MVTKVIEVDFMDYYPKGLRDSDRPLIESFFKRFGIHGYYHYKLNAQNQAVLHLWVFVGHNPSILKHLAIQLKNVETRTKALADRLRKKRIKARKRPHLHDLSQYPVPRKVRFEIREKVIAKLVRFNKRTKPFTTASIPLTRKRVTEYIRENHLHHIRLKWANKFYRTNLLIPYVRSKHHSI